MAGYARLARIGYQHQTVSHKYFFVDINIRAHTLEWRKRDLLKMRY